MFDVLLNMIQCGFRIIKNHRRIVNIHVQGGEELVEEDDFFSYFSELDIFQLPLRKVR